MGKRNGQCLVGLQKLKMQLTSKNVQGWWKCILWAIWRNRVESGWLPVCNSTHIYAWTFGTDVHGNLVLFFYFRGYSEIFPDQLQRSQREKPYSVLD